jgi:hypothetical protein
MPSSPGGRRARVAHFAVRVSNKLARGVDALRALLDEIPLAFYSPAVEGAINESYYAGNAEYVSEDRVRRGFFPYEREMLERYFPPAPARLLVHGAGAGRETVLLVRMGYAVDAYEPVGDMVEYANGVLAASGAKVQQMSLQAWAAAPSGEYDGIFTGWDMWTHIMHHEERVAALRAFLAVCSGGPLLLSFYRPAVDTNRTEWERTREPLHPDPSGRAQRLVRVWLRRRILRRPPLERGTTWETGSYVHATSEAELREEAALAGWRVDYYERDFERYGYAVLLPSETPAGG